MTGSGAYIGRFAPTPSGPLHFGSLVTAVGSYLDAKAHAGSWLLRIEDVDTPRIAAGAADNILFTLERFGLFWDGDVLYQSQRLEAYEAALEQLRNAGLLYACSCSRKQLLEQQVPRGPLGLVYPGHCRSRQLAFDERSLRLRIETKTPTRFEDRHAGYRELDLEREVGDIVLKRVDGIYAYHLAVVTDDAFQGVTDIVRGADLLEVSFVHRHLAEKLGLALPRYLHLPLVFTENGRKLSKQTGARPLDSARASELLWQALRFLGQRPEPDWKTASPEEILVQATARWQPARLPPLSETPLRA